MKKSVEELAEEARVELTPELRVFAWLVEQQALIGFWEAAAHQAKYQQNVLDSFLEKEKKT